MILVKILNTYRRYPNFWIGFSIVLFAFLQVLPQILTGGIIAGSDLLFHYNRFYDTAMQIKTGNFSYFISLFGFDSTARIVNPLYGPYFAYFQGLLVIISQSWFGYQVLSRFLLASLAGLSMYRLSRRVGVGKQTALFASLFFMTTYAIQYWTFRQGFSSWGAALMPWCLIPALDFVKSKDVKIVRLAVSVSLMAQVHILSTFFLILMYIPFYFYGFIKSSEKLKVIVKGLLAVVLSLMLSANVIIAYLQVAGTNTLVQPFVNARLYMMTIDQHSSVWLLTPTALVLIILFLLYFLFRYWQTFDQPLKLVSGTFVFFLILSSSVFPWRKVNQLHLEVVNLIQFPFRFFIPSTILAILSFAMIVNRFIFVKHAKKMMLLFSLIVVFSFKQIIHEEMSSYQIFLQSNHAISSKKHLFVTSGGDKVRSSFYSHDLSEMLVLIKKSTPDYLPTDEDNTFNKYNLYEDYVLQNQSGFSKSQKNGTLTITWTAETTGVVNVPVVKYANTEVLLNGKSLSKGDYHVTGIGSLQVNQKIGDNTLQVTYRVGHWFYWMLGGNLLLWLCLILYKISFFKKRKA